MLTIITFSIFILSVHLTCGLEPSCSRFHYEEKTLEKMIRQEILVERMKTDIEDTKQEVASALADLKRERKVVETLKDTMDEHIVDMENQHKRNIEEFKAEVKRLGDSADSPVVAFNAHVVSDKAMSDGKDIVFSQTLLNTGEAYDKAKGIFVAPVAGIYLFSAQICLGIGTRSYYGIALKGDVISKSLLGDVSWEKCYTLDAIAKVSEGDQVSVKCTTYCSGDNLWEHHLATNSFSGTLIAVSK